VHLSINTVGDRLGLSVGWLILQIYSQFYKSRRKSNMGFLEDLAKNLALWGAVQASKDANGKPDPYKAAGIAAGMGNFSAGDRARLGAMLGSEGAFDDDYSEYCGGSSDYDDAGWKLYCEDGSEYGLDPDDFDTEEEYEEALEEANKTVVKETVEVKATDAISIPITLGVSISGGSKKEESKPQATNREQYAWRKYYKKEEKYGLNIYNFEKESDFLRALSKKKQEALEIALNDKNIYHYLLLYMMTTHIHITIEQMILH